MLFRYGSIVPVVPILSIPFGFSTLALSMRTALKQAIRGFQRGFGSEEDVHPVRALHMHVPALSGHVRRLVICFFDHLCSPVRSTGELRLKMNRG
jgi:hypothetical protein